MRNHTSKSLSRETYALAVSQTLCVHNILIGRSGMVAD